ncbi:hypothetical protein T484DRAFT_2128042 [Baffinella frigidus]|nr:hypothetical protein T484DRAFT_2128042 [Cryptophyta sp. CCMP2293]
MEPPQPPLRLPLAPVAPAHGFDALAAPVQGFAALAAQGAEPHLPLRLPLAPVAQSFAAPAAPAPEAASAGKPGAVATDVVAPGPPTAMQAPDAARSWSEETDGRACLRIGSESIPAVAADCDGNALFPASSICTAVSKLQDKEFADGGARRKACMNSRSGHFRGDKSHFRFVTRCGGERRVVSADQANIMFSAIQVGAMTVARIFSSLFAAAPPPSALDAVPHDVLVKFIQLNPHIATQALCQSKSRACGDAVSVIVQKRFSDRRPAMEDAVAKIAMNMSSGDANDVVFPALQAAGSILEVDLVNPTP